MYVVARSANTNRPVCQHAMREDGSGLALCGYDTTGTSRTYLDQALAAILCKRCEKAS